MTSTTSDPTVETPVETLETLEGGEGAANTLRRPPTLVQVPGGVPDLEARIRGCFPTPPGGLRLRLSTAFYDGEGKTYLSWPEVRWTVDVHSLEQAQRLREGLEEFFSLWVQGEAELLAGPK